MDSLTDLTPASYIVLGLLEVGGESTPYEMRQTVDSFVTGFWPLRRTQLYRESERLARAGLLSERREQGGRRRRHYEITELGREALHEWLTEPEPERGSLRDPALLKLFFGSRPGAIAAARLPRHTARVRALEERLSGAPRGAPRGWVYAIEAELEQERAWVRFFRRLQGTAETRR